MFIPVKDLCVNLAGCWAGYAHKCFAKLAVFNEDACFRYWLLDSAFGDLYNNLLWNQHDDSLERRLGKLQKQAHDFESR